MYNRQTSAFGKDGSLIGPFFLRLKRILARADQLGMVVILQLFYPDEAFKTCAVWLTQSPHSDLHRPPPRPHMVPPLPTALAPTTAAAATKPS